jgi:hypothetical protein
MRIYNIFRTELDTFAKHLIKFSCYLYFQEVDAKRQPAISSFFSPKVKK